jgi:hypothetical protein
MRLSAETLAVHSLRRRPGFALTAILLLALAAGANGAVFSVVRGVLLRPLQFREPRALVALWPNGFVNNEDLTYWRERTRSFEAIAAVSPGWMMPLVADGLEPLKVTGARTSDNFFTTLGVSARRSSATVASRTGLDDRGARRRARSAGLSGFRRARVLSHDALLVDRVMPIR